MNLVFISGAIGADVVIRNNDGRDFASFRVADSRRYSDSSGVEHSETVWHDCILSASAGILPFLKKGQKVLVVGRQQLRVYSSQKDRCMKAGSSIRVLEIELIGGASDLVPRQLFDNNGVAVDVVKFYGVENYQNATLFSRDGRQFAVDINGLVEPVSGGEVS